jgi:S-DNA-T family DNA segregation ATPase FtsK/SpoIIIE
MNVIKRLTNYLSNLLAAFKNTLYKIFFNVINILVGFFIIGVGLIFLIAIGSYNSLDQSLNTISDRPIQNYFGEPGAFVADIFVQFFGTVSILIPVIVILFGFYKIIKKINKLWLKIFSLIVGTFLLTASFNKGFGNGGIVGSLITYEVEAIIYKLSISFNNDLSQIKSFVVFVYIVLGSLGALLITFGILPAKREGIKKEIYNKDISNDDEIITEVMPTKQKKMLFAARPKIKRKKSVQKSDNNKNNLTDSKNGYELPSLDLLNEIPDERSKKRISEKQIEQNKDLLERTLTDFGINGKIISVNPGPFVTLYELEPAPGVKSSRVISLADDISRSMSSTSARIAVIPGKNSIGIELPNDDKETVYLREILESTTFENKEEGIALSLGKNIGGESTIADLSRMPHLMIAGTTGSGKSVGINGMILSILYKFKPEDCRLIMVDPKMIELSVYDGIPHLLTPVITNPKKAVVGLKWVVREMDDRYNRMSKLSVRTMDAFNKKAEEYKRKGKKFKRKIHTGYDNESGQPLYSEEEIEPEKMPFIVVVIDEMADLMLVARSDIEHLVQSLAQKARAAGIHLIMATQRPSVDVVTGTIKANFPTRIAFQVASKIDSRTILNEMGAEQLLGRGDMLYMSDGGKVVRVHGPFVSDNEVEDVVRFIKNQETPEYIESLTKEENEISSGIQQNDSNDELFNQAVEVIMKDKRVSTSYIQRKLQIGYNRAARIIEEMEDQGIISEPNNQGKREILGK